MPIRQLFGIKSAKVAIFHGICGSGLAGQDQLVKMRKKIDGKPFLSHPIPSIQPTSQLFKLHNFSAGMQQFRVGADRAGSANLNYQYHIFESTIS